MNLQISPHFQQMMHTHMLHQKCLWSLLVLELINVFEINIIFYSKWMDRRLQLFGHTFNRIGSRRSSIDVNITRWVGLHIYNQILSKKDCHVYWLSFPVDLKFELTLFKRTNGNYSWQMKRNCHIDVLFFNSLCISNT